MLPVLQQLLLQFKSESLANRVLYNVEIFSPFLEHEIMCFYLSLSSHLYIADRNMM